MKFIQIATAGYTYEDHGVRGKVELYALGEDGCVYRYDDGWRPHESPEPFWRKMDAPVFPSEGV